MEMELVDSVPAPAPAPAAPVEPTPSPVLEAPPVAATPEPSAPVVEAPAPEASAVPTTPEPQLYKLPDGREVDAAGLQREYENLLPEFTRKSQELAALKNPQTPITNEKPWQDPNFQPADWKEAIEIATQEALDRFNQNANDKAQAETARSQAVEAQLAEVKAIDPTVNTDALFDHAVKFGFQNLSQAHTNMKAMADIALTTEQRVLKNLNTRAAEPVATTPTLPPVAGPAVVEFDPFGNKGSALDFLASLKH